MRLIDGDEVLNIIAKYCPDDDGTCSCAGEDLRELLDEIEAIPTVEAEPIKYGYWEWVDGSPDNYDLKCTVCGGVQDSGFWERCPYCGAKMKNGE